MSFLKKRDKVELSVKKWFIIGIIITFLNPIFSGLIVSLGFLTESKLRNKGVILLIISFLWGIILAYILEFIRIGAYL